MWYIRQMIICKDNDRNWIIFDLVSNKSFLQEILRTPKCRIFTSNNNFMFLWMWSIIIYFFNHYFTDALWSEKVQWKLINFINSNIPQFMLVFYNFPIIFKVMHILILIISLKSAKWCLAKSFCCQPVSKLVNFYLYNKLVIRKTHIYKNYINTKIVVYNIY